jgi:hypothetical protein
VSPGVLVAVDLHGSHDGPVRDGVLRAVFVDDFD